MEMDLMRDVQYTKTCCYGTIDPYIVQIHSVLLVLVLIYNKGFQARHLVMIPPNSSIIRDVGVLYAFMGVSYEP